MKTWQLPKPARRCQLPAAGRQGPPLGPRGRPQPAAAHRLAAGLAAARQRTEAMSRVVERTGGAEGDPPPRRIRDERRALS